jgi:ribosome-associated protein
MEGESRDGWVLLDAGDIIIHIFSPEKRNYYKLEDLWSQGKILLHVQ